MSPSPATSPFSRAARRLALPLIVAAVAIAGCSGAAATQPGAGLQSTGTQSTVTKGGPAIGAGQDVAQVQPANVATTNGGGAPGYAGAAYPVPGYGYGAQAVGPEKTIVAVGTGKADMKVDESDRAAAQQKATSLALADAKTQAQAVAAAMGVTISGIYSVGVAVNSQQVYPTTTGCAVVPPVAPNAASSAGTATGATPEPCWKEQPQPTSAQLFVTVTVAYSFS